MADRLSSLALQHALRLAEQNDHERALELLEQLEATIEESPFELQQTRFVIQKEFLVRLRAAFGCPKTTYVPVCSAEELRKHRIRSRDAFVWTQCDGATTLDDLLALAESELETLRSLQKLVALGLLKAAPRPS